MKTTSAEFQRNYGLLSDKALVEPLTITKNGHDRLVLLSVEEFKRLKRRDRRVLKAGELTDEELSAIEKSEVSSKFDYLNKEIGDWKP